MTTNCPIGNCHPLDTLFCGCDEPEEEIMRYLISWKDNGTGTVQEERYGNRKQFERKLAALRKGHPSLVTILFATTDARPSDE